MHSFHYNESSQRVGHGGEGAVGSLGYRHNRTVQGSNSSTSKGSRVRTVLVASADAGSLQLLDVLLMSQGFEVIQCEDGRGVLAFLKENTPDAVIVDINLPDADGSNICSRIRSVNRLAHIAVVLITPSVLDLGGPENLRAVARSTSADFVLPHPLGDKNIVGRLQNLFLEREKSSIPESTQVRTGVAEREVMAVAALEDEVRVLRAQVKAYQRQDRLERSRRDQNGTPGLLAKREQTIKELNERNEVLLGELVRHRETAASCQGELEEFRSLLTERQSSIEGLENRVQSLVEELEQSKACEADLRRSLIAAQTSVSDREDEIADLKRRQESLSAALDERNAAGTALQRELEGVLAKVAECEQEIERLKRFNGRLLQEVETRKAQEAPLREYFQRILQVEQANGDHATNRIS